MTPKLGQKDVYSVLYRSIEKSPRLDGQIFKYDPGKATSPPRSERDGGQPADSYCAEKYRNRKETLNLQVHNFLKYSFMTLKLGQMEVYSVLYRPNKKSPRLDIRLLRYDPEKATSPPRSERAGGQPADSKCAAYMGTGGKH